MNQAKLSNGPFISGHSSWERLTVKLSLVVLSSLALLGGCAMRTDPVPQSLLYKARQIVVVTTPDWTSTSGTLQRFERTSSGGSWTSTGTAVPVVVGRTGIAWGVGFDSVARTGPHKQEGDGKAPAGVFPLDTVFGFAPREAAREVKGPYVQLLPTTDCVDDTASSHYNTVVDKNRVAAVDWNSAEHMRQVDQYKVGVIVGYNARPPIKGRGSCIFLHIWTGPGSHTAGCTAFDEGKLRELIAWLEPDKGPLLVQLTRDEYARVAKGWGLP
jgi:D-alanyl-D-alanine dipeptidase